MRRNIELLAGVLLLCYGCRHPYTQGEQVYTTYCVNCHIEDGTGLAQLIPPLAHSDFLIRHRDQVPCVIRYGSSGGVTVNDHTFSEPMPAFSNLNEVDMSNLINYINTSWGNRGHETSPSEIKAYLEKCPQH